MSQPTTRIVATQHSEQRIEQPYIADRPASLYAVLGRYALLGAAATAMLSVIEWVDLSFQLAPVYASFSERLIFASYFSINLIVGLAIGLLVGLFALSASFLKRQVQSALARGTSPRAPQKLIAGIGNLYADEILFRACMHPATAAVSLTDKDLRRLFRTTRHVLDKAIALKTDFNRLPKSWLLPHRGKRGRCPRCGRALKTATIGGRTSWFCAHCQRRI